MNIEKGPTSRKEREKWGAGGPGFGLHGITDTVRCPITSRSLRKGGNRECRRKFVDPCRVVTDQVAHAASPPTLAKNAKSLSSAKSQGWGTPRLEWRTQTIMKGGPSTNLSWR